MVKYAVVKTGGKQYLVKDEDELIVEKLAKKEKEQIELETIAVFDEKADTLELGNPILPTKVKADVISHLKGDKIRIVRFKAKTRYRRAEGFRPKLTKIMITKI